MSATIVRSETGPRVLQADISQPCPFCGERDTVIRRTASLAGTSVWFACLNCECEGPKAETPAVAAAAWNHRQGRQS